MAQHAGLTEQQVIDIHCGRDYRIFMLGFLPGFPYLGGMDERIVCPRLQTPRTKIPAGAVGIGGKQTGIYPLASPGGWQLIGRTPLRLFDPAGGGKLPYAAGDAMRTANLLAGNPQAAGAAVLEMTLQGGKYQFDGDAVFALAGADMPAALDGRPVPAYTPLLARAGQVLAIGAARSGLRGYLAVFGGVDTPPVLGSRSTDLKCRMGGLDGRALKAGDVLPIGAAPAMVEQRWQQICAKGANRPLGTARTPARPWRFLGGRKLPLFRAVPGPQTDAFTAVGQAAFVHGVYALTADCDRMACKLQGPQIETVDGSDIVSDGIVAGSVQVSANGQPIVMLADHQTTGGYAKIATVISADLSAMAQLRPGEKLAFQYVTAAQAVAGARAQAAVLDKIRERMK